MLDIKIWIITTSSAFLWLYAAVSTSTILERFYLITEQKTVYRSEINKYNIMRNGIFCLQKKHWLQRSFHWWNSDEIVRKQVESAWNITVHNGETVMKQWWNRLNPHETGWIRRMKQWWNTLNQCFSWSWKTLSHGNDTSCICFMVFQGISLLFHAVSWCFKVFHCSVSCCFKIFQGVSLPCFILFHDHKTDAWGTRLYSTPKV